MNRFPLLTTFLLMHLHPYALGVLWWMQTWWNFLDELDAELYERESWNHHPWGSDYGSDGCGAAAGEGA